MDQNPSVTHCDAAAPMLRTVPPLRLVSARLCLTMPAEPAPQGWNTARDSLLAMCGVSAEIAPAMPERQRVRIAGWRAGADRPPAVFAPWIAWSPVAFQFGGMPGLPDAQFAASYLHEHPRGAGAGPDLILMSPHPSRCVSDAAGDVPVPTIAVLQAMLRAAHAEGRRRAAVIVHTRQRNAVAARLMASAKALTGAGPAIAILSIEEALPILSRGFVPWDAILAMPEVRSTIFTLLSETSAVSRAWPMLWHSRSVTMVCSEAAGEAVRRLPLDATALVQALALALDHSGAGAAAQRLHQGWARLRDSGVATTGRGARDAPYLRTVPDEAFIAMLCDGSAVSKRPQAAWQALNGARAPAASSDGQPAALRLVR